MIRFILVQVWDIAETQQQPLIHLEFNRTVKERQGFPSGMFLTTMTRRFLLLACRSFSLYERDILLGPVTRRGPSSGSAPGSEIPIQLCRGERERRIRRCAYIFTLPLPSSETIRLSTGDMPVYSFACALMRMIMSWRTWKPFICLLKFLVSHQAWRRKLR